MDEPIVRVLVVDDFEDWRRFVCATIHGIAGVRVVGEASDGLEAVHKAKELRPDLVLLDIGLPNLNGIEVARRISSVSRESRIIFLTENRSADVMEEGFCAGASGYVVKSDAGTELLSAVMKVLKDKIS